MVPNRWQLPNLGLGVGLRGLHIPHLLQHRPPVDWLEVISDNHMINRGYLLHVLDRLHEHWPIVLHGVSLNLGSTDPLDLDYLRGLKALADRVQTPWLADHVAFTGVDGQHTHDLLPVPYSEAMLRWMTARVRQVQDLLERPLVLENPSSYLQFQQTTMPEWEFLARLAEDADCALLLDLNNVYVASRNHDFDPQIYLDAVPWDRVVQFHLAGHSTYETHLLDTHVGPTTEPVWQLYREAWRRSGGRATLYEWDAEIPPFDELWAEACRAREVVADLPTLPPPTSGMPTAFGRRTDADRNATAPEELRELQRWLVAEVTTIESPRPASGYVRATGALSPEQRVDLHRQMYQLRCHEALEQDFPRTQALLGANWPATIEAFRSQHPSTAWALELYGRALPGFLTQQPCQPRWASDVAALEWARIESTLAPSAGPLQPETLQAMPPELVGQLRLQMAPSLRLLQVASSALSWLLGEPVPGRARPWVAVWRQGWTVQVRALGRTEARLLAVLAAGVSLADGLLRVPAAGPHLGAWLQTWTASGIVVGVEAP